MITPGTPAIAGPHLDGARSKYSIQQKRWGLRVRAWREVNPTLQDDLPDRRVSTQRRRGFPNLRRLASRGATFGPSLSPEPAPLGAGDFTGVQRERHLPGTLRVVRRQRFQK